MKRSLLVGAFLVLFTLLAACGDDTSYQTIVRYDNPEAFNSAGGYSNHYCYKDFEYTGNVTDISEEYGDTAVYFDDGSKATIYTEIRPFGNYVWYGSPEAPAMEVGSRYYLKIRNRYLTNKEAGISCENAEWTQPLRTEILTLEVLE
jgi:hypothetical protein